MGIMGSQPGRSAKQLAKGMVQVSEVIFVGHVTLSCDHVPGPFPSGHVLMQGVG